jgi:hypothetical protein
MIRHLVTNDRLIAFTLMFVVACGGVGGWWEYLATMLADWLS